MLLLERRKSYFWAAVTSPQGVGGRTRPSFLPPGQGAEAQVSPVSGACTVSGLGRRPPGPWLLTLVLAGLPRPPPCVCQVSFSLRRTPVIQVNCCPQCGTLHLKIHNLITSAETLTGPTRRQAGQGCLLGTTFLPLWRTVGRFSGARALSPVVYFGELVPGQAALPDVFPLSSDYLSLGDALSLPALPVTTPELTVLCLHTLMGLSVEGISKSRFAGAKDVNAYTLPSY